MMTLANYGLKSGKYKDPNSAKSLSKSLQIRNRAELSFNQCLRLHYRLPDEKRNDIISSLEEYYARVPYNVVIWNKFQAKQCITDSILLLDTSFNPYKARQAFKTVEDMLINLIYLPWHKEFTKISTYSGQFRYAVSSPLIGVEEVFVAAGFKRAPECSILNLILPDSSLPQKDELQAVQSVIFDCLLAQVILTDVINIFEGCCKASKQNVNEIADSDINCYSWIQAYFRERSHQITDKARLSIQELLKNIPNQLAKQQTTGARSSSFSKNDRISSPLEPSAFKKYLMTSQEKLAAQQEQIRRQITRANIEQANSLRISDDLLKIPQNCDSNPPYQKRNLENSNDCKNVGRIHPSSCARPQSKEWIDANQSSFTQSRQQSTPLTKQASRLGANFDMIDSHSRTDSPRNIGHDPIIRTTRTDVPHNDRELLIPKCERKYMISENPQTSRGFPPHQYYRPHIESHQNSTSQHGLSAASKYQYTDHSASSYEKQAAGEDMMKNSSSRYDGSCNKKYELRDTDRTVFNSRSHWSCISCTYINQLVCDTCEMCGKRRSF